MTDRELTPETGTDKAQSDNSEDVVDDADGIFTPTRKDGSTVPVERHSDQFGRPITVNPADDSFVNSYFDQPVEEISLSEWAGAIRESLVDPDPEAYAKEYGKPEVNEDFVRENVGEDARREIASIALREGGYSDAATNVKGLMTDAERQQYEALLASGDVDFGQIMEKAMNEEDRDS